MSVAGAALAAPMPIDRWHGDAKERVERHLERFFDEKTRAARRRSEASLELTRAVADLTMRGGKRTRSALVLAGHAAVSTDEDTSLLDACAGIELLQTYLLVHDDWMDHDDERRGGPTLHRLFARRFADQVLGDALAVLAGDLAHSFACELFLRGEFSPARSRAARNVIAEMQQDVVWGQQLDLISFRDVALVSELKTGSYSVRGPLVLGAVLGGADELQRRKLDAYARPLGRAFQARDDILGIFGDPARTGKPSGSDLRNGKLTAVLAEADGRLSASERASVFAVVGNAAATDAAVVQAIALLEHSGARRAVEKNIARLRAAAIRALAGPELRRSGVERLIQLADLLLRRET